MNLVEFDEFASRDYRLGLSVHGDGDLKLWVSMFPNADLQIIGFNGPNVLSLFIFPGSSYYNGNIPLIVHTFHTKPNNSFFFSLLVLGFNL